MASNPKSDFAAQPLRSLAAADVLDMVRATYRFRRLRDQLFDPDAGDRMMSEPVWDMLLDLYIARYEERETCISSLCLASGVPTTTALRAVHRMEARGWVLRDRDPADKRRVFVELTDSAQEMVERLFTSVQP